MDKHVEIVDKTKILEVVENSKIIKNFKKTRKIIAYIIRTICEF